MIVWSVKINVQVTCLFNVVPHSVFVKINTTIKLGMSRDCLDEVELTINQHLRNVIHSPKVWTGMVKFTS